MGKRVLITGASGFIGSNVLEYLLRNTDWDFVALCSWRHQGSPLNLRPSSRVQVVTHDLVGPLPDLGDFNYIMHLASESHVDRSIQSPVPFVENNISSTLQVLEYARKCNPETVILFSTDEVYGATHHEDWDVLLPSNPYAASKAAQEMIAIAYWKTYKVPIVITNSNNIVGPHQHPEKFVPKIVQLIKSGERVTIHLTASGKPGKRYWNPVNNVADALMHIAKRKPTRYSATSRNRVDRPDRYAMSGGEELDNLEMAQLVARVLGKPLYYKTINAEKIRPGYDEFYAYSKGRLSSIGWTPIETLEEGLQWIKSM